MQIMSLLQQQGVITSLYRIGDKPSVLVLSKKYDPKSIDHARWLKNQYGTQIVLDLCDNHFYSETNDPKWSKRAQSLRHAIAFVDHVVCSSDALAAVVRAEVPEQQSISVIGDAAEEAVIPACRHKVLHMPAEISLWALRNKLKNSGVSVGRRLVWFGNHGSGNASGGMEDIRLIADAILMHNAQEKIFLTVISNNKKKYQEIISGLGVDSAYLNWNFWTFSRALRMHDIALMPIGVNPFTNCKTNNRVATALKHGVAVAATAIPSYEIFKGSICLNDWGTGLGTLMKDEKMRAGYVLSGRNTLSEEYSLSVIGNRWRTMLEMVDEQN